MSEAEVGEQTASSTLKTLEKRVATLKATKDGGPSGNGISANERFFEEFFRSNPTVQILIDPESGAIVDANNSACEFYGYDHGKFVTLSVIDLNTLPFSTLKNEIDLVKKREQFVFNFRHRIASGEMRDVEVYALPVQLFGRTLLHATIHNVTDRTYSRRIQALLLDIAESASITSDLHDLISLIRDRIGDFVDTTNFYVALYDKKTGLYHFPYHVDERDPDPEPSTMEGSLTDYVRRTGKPLRVDNALFQQLVQHGDVKLVGSNSPVWIGVPLKTTLGVIGVVGMQNYKDPKAFRESQLELLEFVSGAIAVSIERRKAEEALRESEERFRTFVEQSAEGIWSTDLEEPVPTDSPIDEQVKLIAEHAHFSECNETFVQMYAFSSREDVIGKRFQDLPAETDKRRSNASLSRFIREGYRMTDGESWEVVRNGELRVFLNQIIGIVEDGHLIRLWGAQRDITDRKRAEHDLVVQKTHLERFIENSAEGIVFVDTDDYIMSVNKEFSRLFGYTAGEIIGHRNTLIVPEDLRSESEKLVEESMHQESIGLETVRVAKNGRLVDVSILGTPIRIDGHHVGTYWVYRDITERKRSEGIHSALFHISEAANTSSDLDELLTVIHHELGTLIDTTNFYVALYNEERDEYRFQYFVDEREEIDTTQPIRLPGSLTDHVRREGSLLFKENDEIIGFAESIGVELSGPMARSWVGVPLRTPNGVIGVAVLQSYAKSNAYDESDRELLEFVSGHLATAIEHNRWQAAMTASEERYRTLFHQTPVGVVLFDRKLKVIDCNDHLLTIMAIDREQVLGRGLDSLNDRRVRVVAKRALRGKSERFESEYTTTISSKRLWLSGNASPLYGADGEIAGGILLVEDLTAQHETRQELELQKAHTEHLFQNAPEAIVMLHPDERIIRVNGEFARIFGYEEEEVLGHRILPLIVPDELNTDENRPAEIARVTETLHVETWRRRKDGSRVDVSILGAPIIVDDQLVAYYLIYRDITDRKRSERLQTVLFEIAKAAVTTRDLDEFLGIVHRVLDSLINTKNFSVALYDEMTGLYTFPFHVDEYDVVEPHKAYPFEQSLTDYVRSRGESQLIHQKDYKALEKKKIVKQRGKRAKIWIGVPLKAGDRVIGVVSALSYTDPEMFNERDLKLLEFVSGHIASMIEHKRAEGAITESEERYRTLFDQSPVGVLLYDNNLKVTDLNEHHAQILGGKREEIIGTDLYEVRQRDLIPLMEGALQGKRAHYDGQYETIMGRTLWLSINLSPHFGPDGKIVGGIAVILDYTERKKAEERAELSRAYLEQLFEETPEAIVMLDPEFKTIRVNREFANLFQYTPDEVVGKSLEELVLPESPDKDRHLEILKSVAKGETVNAEETICRRKDGSLVDVSLLGTSIQMDGKVIALYGIYRDITRRKRATEALGEEKERLAVTLASIGEGVITTDEDGKVVMINHAAARLTGWSSEEAQGRDFEEVFPVEEKESHQPLENLAFTVLRSQNVEGWSREIVLLTRGGEPKTIIGSAAPIHDVEGKVIGAVVVFRDVSAQRKLEEEVSKVERLESVGVLAGGIAHDFNNILSAVLGNISIAKLIADDQKAQAERLEEAEKATLRARDLTQQLLTFSRGGEPIRKTASISEMIRESSTFALRGSNVRCEFEIADDLWPAEVDEGQVGRVINNLVINADQAMPNGGVVTVHAENVDVTGEMHLPLRPGRYVRIDIVDEGVGIADEYLQKIFDPFFTTKRKGSGLGLATSFSIIQKHEGFIAVQSEVSRGTTFSIYLPASETPVAQKEVDEGENYSGEGRVLVMDDEESVRDVVTVMLTRMGFEVDTAADGASAIELYKAAFEEKKPFNVVIMDLTIPGGMGGEQAIKLLREFDPNVRAIVSSGYSNDPIMSNHEKYGFVGVAAKPFRMAELSRVMRETLAGAE